jgi:hypothetical protein
MIAPVFFLPYTKIAEITVPPLQKKKPEHGPDLSLAGQTNTPETTETTVVDRFTEML